MANGYDDPFADAPAWQGGVGDGPKAAAAAMPAERRLPGLHEEERLPWLDVGDDHESDASRVWAFVLAGFALLLVIVAGVWWTRHRNDGGAQIADGSIIAAPAGPIKEAPKDAGGKTFDGTGDSSFAVSQGHSPGSSLAGGDSRADDGGRPVSAQTPAPVNSATITAQRADSTDPNAVIGAGSSAGMTGVQVGAFATQLAAEAAWARMAKAYDALSGTAHRVVEAKADIGTVYRLQAVAPSDGAATALCARLKTAGLNCQVQD